MAWASVYLIPAGDTTITHFALSDDRGDVLLKGVPVGKYELNAEIIGYNPHKKIYTIKPHWNAYGRFFLFNVSFNFGKMNAKKNSRIEHAVWNMM